MSDLLTLSDNIGGMMGPNTNVMLGDKYVGHFYEDAEDGIDVDATLAAIARRYNAHDELLAGLREIVERSHTDPLGTSKVIDMRKIAEDLLAKHGGEA